MKKTRARSALLLAAATVAVTAISACTNILGGFQLVCEQPCKQPTDCPDPTNPCVQRTCNAGCCDTENVPAAAPAMTVQPVGTCHSLLCDGNGKMYSSVDDSKIPAASDDCNVGGCLAGMPTQSPAKEGKTCSSNGGHVCAGGAAPGTCVACNADEDCPTTMPSCVSSKCFPSTCTDMVKDDLETDVDCGGGSCPPCADGKACGKGADCSSLVCTTEKCQTATCSDMVKNGAETDVDCGGGACPVCAFGLGCKADTDCLSGFCVSGHCGGQAIATGQEAPRGIAVDTSTLPNVHSVYWTSVAGGFVHRVLADDTGGVVTVESGQSSPTSIAIATLAVGSYVVWTDGLPSAEGSVMEASIGMAPLGPAELASQQLSVGLIVADNTNAYWVAGGNLVQAPVGPVGPSDAGMKGTVRGPVVGAAGIAVDSGKDIYWTSASAGTVNGFYAKDSTSTQLTMGQQNPTAIAVDDTNVYWCNTVAVSGTVSGTVMQLPRTGPPAAAVMLATGQDMPTTIALSETDVYWSTSTAGDNRVLKVAIGGGVAPTVLVSGEAAIAAIAVDSGFVYWTNSIDSTIKRVVR